MDMLKNNYSEELILSWENLKKGWKDETMKEYEKEVMQPLLNYSELLDVAMERFISTHEKLEEALQKTAIKLHNIQETL